MSPVKIFEQQYKAAAAEGAMVELKMRLLADKIPELQTFAHDQRLEDVESLIIKHYSEHVTDEEKETLLLCRQLRNKILHCDFHAARLRLNQIGAGGIQRGAVRMTDIHGLSANEVIERIEDVKTGVAGSSEYVADRPSAPGSVFAWLLEAGAAGDFVCAASCFVRATQIIDKLARID